MHVQTYTLIPYHLNCVISYYYFREFLHYPLFAYAAGFHLKYFHWIYFVPQPISIRLSVSSACTVLRASSPLCALWSSKDIHTIACSRLYRVCFPTGFTDVTMSISPWEKIVSLCKINCHSAKTIRYALILKIFSYSEKNAVFCVLKGNYNVYPILLLQNKSGLCESWWCDQQLCSKSSSHV